MEKLKELRECMDKLKERTKELNDKHNKDIDSFIQCVVKPLASAMGI